MHSVGTTSRFNTASGRYCCNNLIVSKYGNNLGKCFNTASGRYCCNHQSIQTYIRFGSRVSIPQAVGTVATLLTLLLMFSGPTRFNTASGRYCCNWFCEGYGLPFFFDTVSIPQAVGTVATVQKKGISYYDYLEFQYRKR